MERLHQPLAGLNVDSIGAKPSVCQCRVEWHFTIPMSARFVDWVGETILRSELRRFNPGYKIELEPFRSTADTLIGDPQYGFPCPWITTHQRGSVRNAYHSSGDTPDLISAAGMCARSAPGRCRRQAQGGCREAVFGGYPQGAAPDGDPVA